jgi:hypothetical protein
MAGYIKEGLSMAASEQLFTKTPISLDTLDSIFDGTATLCQGASDTLHAFAGTNQRRNLIYRQQPPPYQQQQQPMQPQYVDYSRCGYWDQQPSTTYQQQSAFSFGGYGSGMYPQLQPMTQQQSFVSYGATPGIGDPTGTYGKT